MGCNNFLTEQTDKLIEASMNGENSGFSQEALESVRDEVERAIEVQEAAFNEIIESLTSIPGSEPISDFILIHDSPSELCPEPSPSEIEDFVERISSADDKAVLIPLGQKDFLPSFVPAFKDSGEEIKLEVVNYPKNYFPTVKVYTPILPTVENLSRMIKGNNPISPWGKEIELHHYHQDPKGPLMMVERDYHRIGKGTWELIHEKGKGLSLEERKEYQSQRREIWRAMARFYLGNWADVFEQVVREKEEAQKE